MHMRDPNRHCPISFAGVIIMYQGMDLGIPSKAAQWSISPIGHRARKENGNILAESVEANECLMSAAIGELSAR